MVVQVAENPTEVLFAGYKFKRDMFVSDMAWYKFTHSLPMKEEDFVRKIHPLTNSVYYTMYFLLNLEMVDWATIVISGQKRSGKSLCLQSKHLANGSPTPWWKTAC